MSKANRPPSLEAPMLEVRGLTVRVSDRLLVHRVSFSLRQGELVLAAGANGAGKSTLLKSVSGVVSSEGDLLIQGRDLRTLSSRERARRIVYLPQHLDTPQGLSAFDFIRLGRHPWRGPLSRWSEQDDAAVARAIERTGAAHVCHRALETLSGGERQRVFIAAALAQEGGILLLDEPTTALDPVQRDEVWRLLERICREDARSVLVVSHDIDAAARFVDRCIALKSGEIIFEGDPNLLLDGEMRDRTYGSSGAGHPIEKEAAW